MPTECFMPFANNTKRHAGLHTHARTQIAMARQNWLHWIPQAASPKCNQTKSSLHTHTHRERGIPQTHIHQRINRAHTQSRMLTDTTDHSMQASLLTEADRREEICLAKGPNDLICGREPTWLITSKNAHTRWDTHTAGGSSFPALSNTVLTVLSGFNFTPCYIAPWLAASRTFPQI